MFAATAWFWMDLKCHFTNCCQSLFLTAMKPEDWSRRP